MQTHPKAAAFDGPSSRSQHSEMYFGSMNVPDDRKSKETWAAIKHGGSTNGNTHIQRTSPSKKAQKHVVFQLIDTQDPRIQARLPMRVMISPGDDTDSIITTVKNFYGLYDYGVSFENKDGYSIIAAYDNFEDDMTIFVRTVGQHGLSVNEGHTSSSNKPVLGPAFEARSFNSGSPGRHAPRSVGVRSTSPPGEIGRRSMSAASNARARMSKAKSNANSTHEDGDGYSSDDGANASVTSSRRSKTEQVNAEISVDNIVEGGRRKRAFESSVSSAQQVSMSRELMTIL